MLEAAGFRCYIPSGAYYIMTDISGFGAGDDVAFARHLVENSAWPACPGRVSIQRNVRFCTNSLLFL